MSLEMYTGTNITSVTIIEHHTYATQLVLYYEHLLAFVGVDEQ